MGGGGNKIVSVIKNHCYCTKNKPISLLSCGRCQMLWMLIISISNGHLLGLSYLQFLLLISYSITPSNSFNQAISSMVASLFIKLYLPQDIHFTHFQCPIYGHLKPGYPPSQYHRHLHCPGQRIHISSFRFEDIKYGSHSCRNYFFLYPRQHIL